MKVFDTTSKLASAVLEAKQYVMTYGDISSEDLSGAFYFITDSGSLQTNDVTLANGNIAKFVLGFNTTREDLPDLTEAVEAIVNLSGMPEGSDNLGPMTGSVSSNSSIKNAIQSLSTLTSLNSTRYQDLVSDLTSGLSDKISKIESDDNDSINLTDAKTYTDQEINGLNIVSESIIDSKDTNTFDNSKAYTDQEINGLDYLSTSQVDTRDSLILNQAETYTNTALNSKADLTGNVSQKFNVAAGSSSNNAVNKSQLDTKANLGGNTSQKFNVDNATSNSNAVNKGQLDSGLSSTLQEAKAYTDANSGGDVPVQTSFTMFFNPDTLSLTGAPAGWSIQISPANTGIWRITHPAGTVYPVIQGYTTPGDSYANLTSTVIFVAFENRTQTQFDWGVYYQGPSAGFKLDEYGGGFFIHIGILPA